MGTDASSYEVLSRVQTLACDRVVPLNVTLELTLNCNIRCLHCYNFDRDDRAERRRAGRGVRRRKARAVARGAAGGHGPAAGGRGRCFWG